MSKKNDDEKEYIRVRRPNKNKNELYAIIESVYKGSRMKVVAEDGTSRIARIPGSKRRGMGRIRRGDLVIIVPWDIQPDEKADIIWRYWKNQARFLSQKGLLPDQVDIF
ncbi:MAG: translation initiation factor 1A [Candidatus Thermoplasmatota archaeon]|nr:translation initiation factor 1A [Candidatus Thermoplasmatota archaeon]